jgi:cyclic pyranopterin phosphate synthase
VTIQAEARTTWKTGVEMEAMTAATAAALTVMDMGKAIDRGIVIESVRLLSKTGGRRGDYTAPDLPTSEPEPEPEPEPEGLTPPIRVAVLTVSDRCSAGLTTDTSGPALVELCKQEMLAEVIAHVCRPDEPQAIRDTLTGWADAPQGPDLILTTGGTGLAPRDHAPEATAAVLERRHPGLLELARMRCYDITPRTFLSRGESGTRKGSLIINLPGSRGGCTETLRAILDVLPHAIETLRGDVKDDGRRREAEVPHPPTEQTD